MFKGNPVEVDGVTYPTKKAAIVALHEQGMLDREIAAKVGTTLNTVQVTKPKLANDPEPSRWTEEKLDKAVRLFPACIREVAAALDVPENQVRALWIKGKQPPLADAGNVAGVDRYVPPPAEVFEPDGDGREADEAELAKLDWVDDPEATFNILMLTDADVTREVVDAWSPEQRRQAEEWAGAMHTAASDNDDIVVPPRPHFVQLRDWSGRNLITGQPVQDETAEVPAVPVSRFPDPPRETTTAAPPRLIPPGGIFPANRSVRLVQKDGRYLHESLEGFTDKAKYAWSGDRTRFETVKARMPKIVAKLSMEVVL